MLKVTEMAGEGARFKYKQTFEQDPPPPKKNSIWDVPNFSYEN